MLHTLRVADGGRRRPSNLPHLPLTVLQHRLDTSSGDAEGKRVWRQDPKTLRSTSNTPRSTTPVGESGRAKAPFELDKLMGIVHLRE